MEAISYDYKTVKVKREMETIVADSYANLGWELTGSSIVEFSVFHVNLSFKRDRKIENKMNLIKLQEKVDNIILNIETLLASKRSAGVPITATIGTIGALLFGGGLSMAILLEGIGNLVGGIVLGVVGIGVCLLSWAVYKKVRRNKLSKISPLLESEYDKLADVCEQARK
ncbi:MAG: hypothetical protein LBM99_05960 [Bacillales bacterium]|nr:hypothetical protein [Bacillales bacterium]